MKFHLSKWEKKASRELSEYCWTFCISETEKRFNAFCETYRRNIHNAFEIFALFRFKKPIYEYSRWRFDTICDYRAEGGEEADKEGVMNSFAVAGNDMIDTGGRFHVQRIC